ncbi:hypothetical protein [Bathymodiolus thermophilus thioautotrophic gill symbiont]|nr:hypothetical protein [Bathymodiolus thermophilus thioautotrophic gill symbiont]
MTRLKNDASASIKGSIYQFYVALEECFKLVENESIYIEKYGDVTSDGTQMEVKNYTKSLTNLDPNFWKTLKNWLNDDFDISPYKNLILLTTQNIGSQCLFKDWNEQSDSNSKIEILQKIEEKSQSESKISKVLNFVLDEGRREKLLQILEKFEIYCSKPKDDIYYKELKDKYCKHIPEENKNNYIDALMGYIISPEVSNNGWKIKYVDFSQKAQTLTEKYVQNSTIFPDIKKPSPISDKNYLFVKKIQDIEYEAVVSDAISDFIRTRSAINTELQQYQFNQEDYRGYEENIYNNYIAKRRILSRSADKGGIIGKSQDLYDEITGQNSPNFKNFNDTPTYFRNGLLHEMANDGEIPDKVVWKIKVDNNE